MRYTGDGVAFHLFGLEVRWYGVFIVIGMMLAVLFAGKEAKRRGLKEEDISDLSLYMLPLGIVGARIWYVIFEWERYRGDFFKMINVREGGLAIQGGIIAALIVAYFYARKRDIYFLRLTDIAFPFVAMAQSIGRWGNFTNNEAYGTPTELPWGLWIGEQRVHPTFLYESMGTMAIFLFLLWFTRKKIKWDGQATAWYLILYGTVRFFVEGFRTDSLYVGNFRTAQIVAITGIFLGVGLLFLIQRREAKAHIPGRNPYKEQSQSEKAQE